MGLGVCLIIFGGCRNIPSICPFPEEESGLCHRDSECHRCFLGLFNPVLVLLFRATFKVKPWCCQSLGWSWSVSSCIPQPKHNVTGAGLRILGENMGFDRENYSSPHPIPALMLAL